MPGNGKVFISHAHTDIPRCQQLLDLLRVWGVDFWFDVQQMSAGEDLTQAIQDAIRERDIFLRVCTPAAQSSYWMRLEAGAARGLEASSPRGQRAFINLILDAAYQPEPFDHASVVIDTVHQPPEKWQRQLRRALGLPERVSQPASTAPRPQARPGIPAALSKRTAVAALAAAVLLVAFAGVTFASQGGRFAFMASPAPTHTATATPTISPTPSPTLSPTPLVPAKLAANATQGMFGLFTIRFPADWPPAQTGGSQSYGMDAGGQNVFMQFSLADPNHASWSDTQWLDEMFQNTPHTAFTPGTRTIGGVAWTSYTCQEQITSNSVPYQDEVLFGRHNGNTLIIELQGRTTDFHYDDVVYFTPALQTFAFTS